MPAALRIYALKQIKAAVLTGSEPTRPKRLDGDGMLDAGCINPTEVELLKRVIYAQAGTGGWIVLTEEADMLFRLKDATLGAPAAGRRPERPVRLCHRQPPDGAPQL